MICQLTFIGSQLPPRSPQTPDTTAGGIDHERERADSGTLAIFTSKSQAGVTSGEPLQQVRPECAIAGRVRGGKGFTAEQGRMSR
jgi:phage repressor protein C with HTH and peptisase S24 domain